MATKEEWATMNSINPHFTFFLYSLKHALAHENFSLAKMRMMRRRMRMIPKPFDNDLLGTACLVLIMLAILFVF